MRSLSKNIISYHPEDVGEMAGPKRNFHEHQNNISHNLANDVTHTLGQGIPLDFYMEFYNLVISDPSGNGLTRCQQVWDQANTEASDICQSIENNYHNASGKSSIMQKENDIKIAIFRELIEMDFSKPEEEDE